MNRIEVLEASLHGSRRAQGLLLQRYGIANHEENQRALAAYAARVRRARWWGVAGVLMASGLGWLGPAVDAAGWNLSLLLAGYLIGSGVAEFASPALQHSGPTHATSLAPRAPASLLPLWARVLPWLSLVPCLAAPLIIVGNHPVGVTRFKDSSGYVWASAAWFPSSVLMGTAVLALAALLMSEVCTSVTDCHYVYGWHDQYSIFQDLGALMVAAGVLLFCFSRLPRVNRALLPTTAAVSS